MTILALSPHMDDAVFSVGALLAGASRLDRSDAPTIATIFTGKPDSESMLTSYDASCGFSSSRQAVETRRREDARACLVLCADSAHFDLLDLQYRAGGACEPGRPAELRAAVDRALALAGPHDTVLAPLGLAHPDHAALSAAALNTGRALWLYEELPYRVLSPEFAVERVAGLRAAGLRLELLPEPPSDQATKLAAVACYRSQLGGSPPPPALLVPERVWSVER